MTHPSSPCERLDAYLGGRLAPDAEAAFEAHLETCEACLDAAAPSEATAAALSALGAVACPPAVLEAALAQARRPAADRPAAMGPRRTRRTVVWVGLAAALALAAASVVWIGTPASAPEPLVAEGPVADPPPSPLPDSTRPEPDAPETGTPEAVPSEPAPSVTPAPDVVEVAPPAPAPRPDRLEAPAAPTPETPAPEAAPHLNLAATPDAAPDSVAIARDEMRLALAIVGDAQDRAADAVAGGVGLVASALHTSPLSSPQTP